MTSRYMSLAELDELLCCLPWLFWRAALDCIELAKERHARWPATPQSVQPGDVVGVIRHTWTDDPATWVDLYPLFAFFGHRTNCPPNHRSEDWPDRVLEVLAELGAHRLPKEFRDAHWPEHVLGLVRPSMERVGQQMSAKRDAALTPLERRLAPAVRAKDEAEALECSSAQAQGREPGTLLH